MAKRSAATELTDRNWDQEEEPEEAGVFQKASDDAMKGRQILKARRRQPGDEGNKTTAFSGFGGLAFKPTQTSTPLLGFGFKTESKLPTGKEEKSEDVKMTEPEKVEDKTVQEQNGSESWTKYLSNLKALNQSVTQWISQHVEKNPYCLLSPIFKDYENHLVELKKERGDQGTNGTEEASSKPEPSKEAEEVKPLPKTGLTFGLGNLKTENTQGGTTAPAETTKPAFSGFSFGTAASSQAATSGFSFAVGNSKPEKSKGAEGGGGEEEEHVPPVVESIQHKEEGSLFSKKCKLFYQKDGAWVEKGVGFLHLKQPEGKSQLLVRADTTLGNILLNIRLSESIPLKRQGKNSITMMCIVNPEIPKVPKDKAIPMLIRVKSAEDADVLLEKMKELQN